MEMTPGRIFTEKLLRWHREENRRQMPWKGEKDPYRIWISEVILQQTRVEQGLAYYQRFVEAYPGILQLAKAPDAEVFKKWEGLGYYSRCRNMLATARLIAETYKGVFPKTYHEILALKGIGPYTAAAISSFAYNLPYAVTDGNVMRVLSRFFAIHADVSTGAGKKKLAGLAQSLLPPKKSALFNQAIMDFGATVCKPMAPACGICPLASDCLAFRRQEVSKLPVKTPKPPRKERFFYYLLIEHKGKIAVKQREGNDIWRHLHEFFLFETPKAQTAGSCLKSAPMSSVIGKDFTVVFASKPYRQLLTHQEISGFFLHIRVKKSPELQGFEWLSPEQISKKAFPRFINFFLDDYFRKKADQA